MEAEGTRLIELLLMLTVPLGGGSDLLDCVSTDDYWQSKRVVVSVQTMSAELQVGETADVTKLIEDLGSDDFRVRETATAKIRAQGPLVVEQLEAAAKSKDPEIAYRAKLIMRDLGRGQKLTAGRRLMAIRALGELKDREGLAALRTVLDSKEPFVAEYAQQAIASIEGKPYTRPRPTREKLDKEIQLLPQRCGVVAQWSVQSKIDVSFEDAMKTLGEVMPGGGDADRAKAMALRIKAALHVLVDQIGNVRIDAVTFAVADEIGPSKGFVVIQFVGLYNRQAVKAIFEKQGLKADRVGGVDVLAADDEVRILLPSDKRLIFLAGDEPDDLPLEEMLATLKTGKGKLASNKAMMELIESIDRPQTLWLAAKMSDTYKQAPLLAPLDTVTLVVKQKENSLSGKLVARGAEGEKLNQAVKMFDEAMKQTLKQGKKKIDDMPALKPLLAFLETVRHEKDGGTVTITAHVDDAGKVLQFPMVFPLMLMGMGF